MIRLKDDHARLSERFSKQIDRIPDLSADPSESDERRVNMLAKTWVVLRETREMMMRMALHPTCPKANGQSGNPRGRPRNVDPTLEAHVVSVPQPTPTANGPSAAVS